MTLFKITHKPTQSDDLTTPLNPSTPAAGEMPHDDGHNRILPIHRSVSPSVPDIVMTEPTYKSTFLPSEPPQLYSAQQTSSNSSSDRSSTPPSPTNGYYRTQNMLYSSTTSRQGTPMPSPSPSIYGKSETSSVALLSPGLNEREKDQDDTAYNGYFDESSSNVTHVRGKRYVSFFRMLFGFFSTITSLLCLVMTSVVIWGIYSPNKTRFAYEPGNTSNSNKPPIFAFPQDVEPVANNLLLTTSFIGTLFGISVMIAPMWRSHRNFNHKRYSHSEIYEIVGNLVLMIAGAAGLYFAFTKKENADESLWGFMCTRGGSSLQTKLFTDIKYDNGCDNYSAGVYLLVGKVVIGIASLATFTINPCLKRKKGEYQRDDSKYCMAVGDCCSSFCVALPNCCCCCD